MFSWSKVNSASWVRDMFICSARGWCEHVWIKDTWWWRTSLKISYRCEHKTIQDLKTRRWTRRSHRCTRWGLGMGSRVYGYGALQSQLVVEGFNLIFSMNGFSIYNIYSRRHYHVLCVNILRSVARAWSVNLDHDVQQSMRNRNSKGACRCLEDHLNGTSYSQVTAHGKRNSWRKSTNTRKS
jgi:hypothetical protein